MLFKWLAKFSYISVLLAKLARLKQAKEEADKEIAQYRAQVEAQFQKKVAEVVSLLVYFFWVFYCLSVA